ncbi:hypothetical protein PR048_023994 [Dryococelus australis]|uniref:Uncharacterized protein n=1 Tax=Dryococelus australis TaxID=614101 RepID=A0ABQ9GVM2_9NEOP|nr:hypothetical protein PR048_023994 [Dryococelus australis]
MKLFCLPSAGCEPKNIELTVQHANLYFGKQFSLTSPTGFSQVGIVPDDAIGRRVFSGISRFPHPFIPALINCNLTHPHRLSRPRCSEPRRSLNPTRLQIFIYPVPLVRMENCVKVRRAVIPEPRGDLQKDATACRHDKSIVIRALLTLGGLNF